MQLLNRREQWACWRVHRRRVCRTRQQTTRMVRAPCRMRFVVASALRLIHHSLCRYAGRKVMLGVDRLDMIKGIPQVCAIFLLKFAGSCAPGSVLPCGTAALWQDCVCRAWGLYCAL